MNFHDLTKGIDNPVEQMLLDETRGVVALIESGPTKFGLCIGMAVDSDGVGALGSCAAYGTDDLPPPVAAFMLIQLDVIAKKIRESLIT